MTPEGKAYLLEMLNRPPAPELPGPPRPEIIPTWTGGEPDNLAAAVADAVAWLDWIKVQPGPQAARLARCRYALARLANNAIREMEQ